MRDFEFSRPEGPQAVWDRNVSDAIWGAVAGSAFAAVLIGAMLAMGAIQP